MFFLLKGTVIVISSDPPCKDGNAQLKKVPLKPLYGKYCSCSSLSVFLRNHFCSVL